MKLNYIKIIVLCLLMELIANGKLFAQQDAMYSQYMSNIQVINPAYAGSKDALSATLISRNQWVGFEGAPNTTSISAHLPIKDLFGLGISYINDEIGPTKISFMSADISARVKVGYKGYLAAGIKAGVDYQEINFSALTPAQKEDIYYQNYSSDFKPNFGVGLFYYTDKFYLGLSSPRIMRRDLVSSNTSKNKINTTERNFYFNGGYVMDVNRNLKFKPSFMVKYVSGAPLSFDLTAAAMLKEKIIAGLSMRDTDSFGGLIQLRVAQHFWFGYAYDISTSHLRKYNSGSHEVMISFDLGVYKRYYKDGLIRSPRFF